MCAENMQRGILHPKIFQSAYFQPQLDVGWVHPWAALDWVVKLQFCGLVGLGQALTSFVLLCNLVARKVRFLLPYCSVPSVNVHCVSKKDTTRPPTIISTIVV